MSTMIALLIVLSTLVGCAGEALTNVKNAQRPPAAAITLLVEVETYEDHRMAMAFTLIGLKTGKVTILNPLCCRKTFENYFDLIEELYG